MQGISYIPAVSMSYFELPVNIEYDYQYYKQLGIRFEQYIKTLEYLMKEKGLDEKIVESTKNNIAMINESLKNYHNAKIDLAKQNILNILGKYSKNEYIVNVIDKSYACRALSPFHKYNTSIQHIEDMKSDQLNFFRARLSSNTLNKKDMLHIPFDKRDLISTERFSIPGVPCLYLGTTSYVCWLEMGKPINADFYISSFKIPLDIKIIDLTVNSLLHRSSLNSIYIDGWDNNGFNKNIIAPRIEFWPLICATSFSARHSEGKFKSEYIISHLVMQCLEDLKLDGIAYMSKKVMNESIGYPQCVNIAIPMKSNGNYDFSKDTNKYSDIAQKLKLTNPVNLAEYQMLEKTTNRNGELSFINKHYNDSPNGKMIEFGGGFKNYNECIFSGLDNYLINLHHDIYLK